MLKKILLFLVLLTGLSIAGQTSFNGQNYSTFSSRSFMKFNRFLTNPTFSTLKEDKASLSALVRNSNITFDDNPRLYLFSYAGKMRENIGAGLAIYQQEVGAMKDFGALANYAQKIQMNSNLDLTFGFNFLYSRSSIDWERVLVQNQDDVFLNNFQDIPVVMLQPAITLSYGKFDVGVFFENLIDFDLKKSEMATSFGQKTFALHAMYSHEFTYADGLLEGADLRMLAIARKPGEQNFNYGANVIFDLPKAGWLKAGYDKDFGISAGVGVNISDNLAIGFNYEKSNFAATNEVGIIYKLDKKSYSRKRPKRRPSNISVTLPKRTPKQNYKNEEHNDLSDEIEQAQDSINKLNKKVEEILQLLKGQPQATTTVTTVTKEQPNKPIVAKDTSLKRRTAKPWRERFTFRRGSGGGTMYYIVLDQFRNKVNADALINKFKKRKGTKDLVKYVYEPKKKIYYVYVERFAKEKDADEMLEDFNDTTRQFENEGGDDVALQVKKVVKDPVYKVKITLGNTGTYKVPKKQRPARIRTLSNTDGLESGYYLQVYVNGEKAYADRNVDELQNDGINAGYFINPTTGNYHTYIVKTKSKQEAIKLYNNNLNGTFYNSKSIIFIK